MARRNQSAQSGMLIGLVVLALLAGSAAFVAYDFSAKLEKVEIDLKNARTVAKGYEQDLIEEKRQRTDERRYVFGGDTKNLKSLQLWMVEKFADRLDPRLQTNEEKLKYIRQEGIVVTDYDLPDKEFTQFKDELTQQYDNNLKSLREENKTLVSRREELEERFQSEVGQLQTTIDELNVEVGNLNQRLEEMISDHATEVELLNQRIQEQKLRITYERRDHSVERRRLEIEVSRLENLLDQKTGSLRDQLLPDGEVINVDSSIHTSTAYINLGRQDKITRGMRFDVFQWSHAGTQHKKAEVIVREVYDHTSKVGIINLVNSMDPVVEGDLIANIVYDVKQTRSFALIGSFEGFTKDELKRLIERDGGDVSDTIDASLDHVVVGRFSDSETDPENTRFQRARDLHIPILNEKEIQRFLRDYTNGGLIEDEQTLYIDKATFEGPQ